jgi:hypothetical protein
MKNKIYSSLLYTAILIAFILIADASFAQCSMCKAVLESNLESGESSLGKGINDGIAYLIIFPYLLIGTIGYFMYRHYKKNNQAEA